MRTIEARGRAGPSTCMLVLDVEATCDEEPRKLPGPREIIQIAVVVHAPAGVFADRHGHRFAQLVRPADLSGITDFCARLTGISQERATAEGVPFREALGRLSGWLVGLGFLVPVQSRQRPRGALPLLHATPGWVFATYGSCDLAEMWPQQCALVGIPVAPWFRCWVDVAREFRAANPGQKRLLSLRDAVSDVCGPDSFDADLAHDAMEDAVNCAAVLHGLRVLGRCVHTVYLLVD